MRTVRRMLMPVVAVTMAIVAVPLHTSASSGVPFRATLTEIGDGPGPGPCFGVVVQPPFGCVKVTGNGLATHLGPTSESAVVVVDFSTANPATGCADEIRTSTLTAVNGDSITLQGPSVAGRDCLGLHPTWQDLWTVISGTGRFAGATGSGTNTVTIDRSGNPGSPVTSVTTFTGTISY